MNVNPRPRSELVEMLLETRKERDELKARVAELELAQTPRPISSVVIGEVTVILGELEPNEWSVIEWVPESRRWCVFEDEELNAVYPRRFLPCPPGDQSGEGGS